MKEQNYSTTLLVDQSPQEVFAAIKNVRGWWSEEILGYTSHVGAEFTYHYQDVQRCRFLIEELVPREKIIWLVLDSYFNFAKDDSEWTGTRISFEIFKKDDHTQINFTHLGLIPHFECYNSCSNSWGYYINGSLRSLITTGKGQPNLKI